MSHLTPAAPGEPPPAAAGIIGGMSIRIDLPVGTATWALTVRPDALVGPAPSPPIPEADPRELVRAALEAPLGLNAPLRRALTPDDRVALVLDPHLPRLADLLAAVFEHLASAGVQAESVTMVTPPGSSDAWLVELPDEYADAKLEVHDPADRNKLAYLATTKAGRRVYLNRTVVDADFTISLSARGYDPTLGYAGGEAAIFPALSDAETRADLTGTFSPDAPGAKPSPARAEAAEVIWLLGTPLLVQVIPGPEDAIAEVVAGLPEAAAEGVKRHDARWRVKLAERPDLVVAAVAGDPGRADFGTLAAALAAAARVVKQDGRIALLSAAAPALPEAADLLRRTEDPLAVAKALLKQPAEGSSAALLWAFAVRRASLFVAAGWPSDTTEELFATPLASAAEVQRLIDAAGKVLVLPDADKTMAEVG